MTIQPTRPYGSSAGEIGPEPEHVRGPQPGQTAAIAIIPQDSDVEMAVLGAVMLEPVDGHKLAASLLRAEMFYIETHGTLFTLFAELTEQGIPPDPLAVLAALRARRDGKVALIDKIGGAGVINAMLQQVPTAANLEHHCQILIEKFRARQLIRGCHQVIAQALAQETTLDTTLDLAAKVVEHVRQTRPAGDPLWMDQAGKPVWDWHAGRINEIDEWCLEKFGRRFDELPAEQRRALRPPAAYRGLHMGLKQLQRMTGGAIGGTVTVIGGRTSMGKTEYACDLTRIFAVEQHVPVGWISLETDADVLYTRILLASTYQSGIGVALNDFENPHRMSSAQHQLLTAARRTVDRAPIDIDDRTRTLPGILRAIQRMAKGGCRVVFIDYLQLIGKMADTGARHLDLGESTRELKALARELKITLFELAQLNRNTEARGKDGRVSNTRPNLADFRESDSISHDADVVIFPYRPAYYRSNDPEYERSPWELETDAELILAKNKRGGLGVVKAYRVPEVGRWLQPDTGYAPGMTKALKAKESGGT